MNRQKVKARENKITEFIMLSIFAFCIVIALLNSISVQPNVTDISFYLLLIVVITSIYRPLRSRAIKTFIYLIKFVFSFLKSIFHKKRLNE